MATNLEKPNANAETWHFEKELAKLKERILGKETKKQPQKKEGIPALTKEEYETLCEKPTLSNSELKKVIQYNKDMNEGLPLGDCHVLSLGIKTLTDEQAFFLARSGVVALSLKLDKITDNQATILGNCKYLRIELSAATNTQIKNLTSLKGHYISVILPQITKIQSDLLEGDRLTIKTDVLTAEQAYILSGRGNITVLGLKQMDGTIHSKPGQNIKIEVDKMSDAQMEALCKAKFLVLNKLTTLTDKQAESLSKGNFSWLGLNGLTSLTNKQAELLSKGNFGNLSLFGLKKLTDKQAEILSKAKAKKLRFNTKILTPKQKAMFEKTNAK